VVLSIVDLKEIKCKSAKRDVIMACLFTALSTGNNMTPSSLSGMNTVENGWSKTAWVGSWKQ